MSEGQFWVDCFLPFGRRRFDFDRGSVRIHILCYFCRPGPRSLCPVMQLPCEREGMLSVVKLSRSRDGRRRRHWRQSKCTKWGCRRRQVAQVCRFRWSGKGCCQYMVRAGSYRDTQFECLYCQHEITLLDQAMLTEPLLGPSTSADSKVRDPPIFCIRPRATSRPSPRPSLLRAEPLSSRENALNSSDLKLGLIPGPVSVIVTQRAPSCNVALSRMEPPRVNFKAFCKRHAVALARELALTDPR